MFGLERLRSFALSMTREMEPSEGGLIRGEATEVGSGGGWRVMTDSWMEPGR